MPYAPGAKFARDTPMLVNDWPCTRLSGLTTHGGGLQADDVRTRQSGLTTSHSLSSGGLQADVRTRQSGLTTSQKPVILSHPFKPCAHALVVSQAFRLPVYYAQYVEVPYIHSII